MRSWLYSFGSPCSTLFRSLSSDTFSPFHCKLTSKGLNSRDILYAGFVFLFNCQREFVEESIDHPWSFCFIFCGQSVPSILCVSASIMRSCWSGLQVLWISERTCCSFSPILILVVWNRTHNCFPEIHLLFMSLFYLRKFVLSIVTALHATCTS